MTPPPVHLLIARRQTACGASPMERIDLFPDRITCPACQKEVPR